MNKTIVENLRAIGAFASIEPSEPSAKDLSRRKDQMRLLPGLIIDSVKADRYTDTSEPFLRASLVEHMRDCKQCNGCDLAGQVHPDIRLGKKDTIYGCFGLSNLGGRKERKNYSKANLLNMSKLQLKKMN